MSEKVISNMDFTKWENYTRDRDGRNIWNAIEQCRDNERYYASLSIEQQTFLALLPRDERIVLREDLNNGGCEWREDCNSIKDHLIYRPVPGWQPPEKPRGIPWLLSLPAGTIVQRKSTIVFIESGGRSDDSGSLKTLYSRTWMGDGCICASHESSVNPYVDDMTPENSEIIWPKGEA